MTTNQIASDDNQKSPRRDLLGTVSETHSGYGEQYQFSIDRQIHILACAVLGLDDSDHEDDEEAKPLEDAIRAITTQAYQRGRADGVAAVASSRVEWERLARLDEIDILGNYKDQFDNRWELSDVVKERRAELQPPSKEAKG